MKKNIKETDILRYIYKETSAEESAQIEEAIFGQEEMGDEFYSFVDLKKELDQLPQSYSPSKRSIDNILKFSKNYRTESVKNNEQ